MWRERASSLWLCLVLLAEATGVEATLFGPTALRLQSTQVSA